MIVIVAAIGEARSLEVRVKVFGVTPLFGTEPVMRWYAGNDVAPRVA